MAATPTLNPFASLGEELHHEVLNEGYSVEEQKYPFIIELINRIHACSLRDFVTIARAVNQLSWGREKIPESEIDFQRVPTKEMMNTAHKAACLMWSFVGSDNDKTKSESELHKKLSQAMSMAAVKYFDQLNNNQLVLVACALDDIKSCTKQFFTPQAAEFFRKVADKFPATKTGMTPYQIAWIAFACRKVTPLPGNLFYFLRDQWVAFQATHPDVHPRDIAILAKSFTQTFTALSDVEVLPREVEYLVSQKKRGDLLAWSGQRVHLESFLRLYENLSNWIESKIDAFEALDVSHALWAYAYLKWNKVLWKDDRGRKFLDETLTERINSLNRKVVKLLKEPAIRNMPVFDTDNLTKVYWSFRMLGESDPRLLQSIYQRITQDIKIFTPIQIGTIFRQLVNHKPTDPNVLFQLVKHIESEKNLGHSDLIKIAFGMVIVYSTNRDVEGIVRGLLDRILKSDSQTSVWLEAEISQLRTIYHFYRLKSGNSVDLPQHLATLIKRSEEKPKSSDFHEEVAGFIESIRVDDKKVKPFQNEFPFFSFFLDIAFEDEKIAIEVDGPFHFDTNSKEYKEKEKIKEEMLRMSGWTVIHITYKEWESLYHERSKIQFLLGKLPQALLVKDIPIASQQPSSDAKMATNKA